MHKSTLSGLTPYFLEGELAIFSSEKYQRFFEPDIVQVTSLLVRNLKEGTFTLLYTPLFLVTGLLKLI